MVYIILLVSLILFYIFGAIAGVNQTKRTLENEIDENIRVTHFAVVTFAQWIPIVAIFLVVAFSDITFTDIGFTLPSFRQLNPVMTITIIAGAVLWATFIFYRIIIFLISPKHRQKCNNLLHEKVMGDDYYDLVYYKLMTPRTKREKRWWLPLSLSAGVCEEIVFRGVFVFLVASIFPNISIYLVFIILVGLFGLFHFYQGVRGFIFTTLAGAFFTLLYIASGTLIFVIVLHFLVDIAGAFRYSDDSSD